MFIGSILSSVSIVSKVMSNFDKKLLIIIVTFWIFVPTLDMISDMTMVIRLFMGPEPELVLSGGQWTDVNCSSFLLPSSVLLDLKSSL